MQSKVAIIGSVSLPLIEGKHSMLPFDLQTLEGLPEQFKATAAAMLKGIKEVGTAFFTIEGKQLKAGQTLRRPGAHIDGNYEPHRMSFGDDSNGGWKTGGEGSPVGHPTHTRQFCTVSGGIILASNFPASQGWVGEYEGVAERGGDCTHIELDTPFMLQPDVVYYGNAHFIHESLPMSADCHRVFARITLPETHQYAH